MKSDIEAVRELEFDDAVVDSTALSIVLISSFFSILSPHSEMERVRELDSAVMETVLPKEQVCWGGPLVVLLFEKETGGRGGGKLRWTKKAKSEQYRATIKKR